MTTELSPEAQSELHRIHNEIEKLRADLRTLRNSLGLRDSADEPVYPPVAGPAPTIPPP
jgi:hypothetical protein